MVEVSQRHLDLEVYLIIFLVVFSHQVLNVLGYENLSQVGGNHHTVEPFRGGLPSLEVNLCYLVDSVFHFDDELVFFLIYS